MTLRRRWGPALDVRAFADATTYAGLAGEVRLELSNALAAEHHGCYSPHENAHVVVVSATLVSPRELSRTIWHELCHAAQCQTYFDNDGAAFVAASFAEAVDFELSSQVGKLEAEARAWEDLDYDLRLVRMVKQ